jgi:hypothetical protein
VLPKDWQMTRWRHWFNVLINGLFFKIAGRNQVQPVSGRVTRDVESL